MKDDQKKKTVVKNPHDATFKKAMKEKSVAKDIIQHNLPEEILKDLDLDTLELLDGSFVSEKLQERFTDVLYGITAARHDVYIAFLFEHKSYPDRFAIFQVGRYLMDLWESVFQERGDVPIVFPIIFYHGESDWNYATDLRKYIRNYEQLPEYMHERLPTLKHDFITMKTHDATRMRIYKPYTRLYLRSFKYIFANLEELIEALLMSVHEMQGNVSEEDTQREVEVILLYYTQANRHITEEMIIEHIQKLDGKGAEIMTILEERERKGRQEGREKSALNMLKDGLAVDRVAKYAELPVEKVKELKRKIKKLKDDCNENNNC